MAIMHVSIQRGSDAYSKEQAANPATPWATITKAIGEVAAGDTVYIGPGTYREKPSFATAGVAGNIISWIPDPSAKYVTGDNPGIVRVTGCNANELPTSGIVWNYNAKDYNTIGSLDGRIYIDGSSDNYSVSAASGTDRIAINVTAHGYNGFTYGTNTNCIAVGGLYGFNYGTNINCISIGGQYGFNLGTNTNCIAIGASSCFYFSTSINCIAIGGSNGFNDGTSTNCIAIGGNSGFIGGINTNCIALGGYYGFNGSGSNVFSYCRAIACFYGFYGTSTTNKQDISTCSRVWCRYSSRATYDTGNSTAAKAVIYDLALIAQAFRPLLQFDRNDGGEGNLSCIGVLAADTVTINGITFTAHATTTTVASRQFSIAGTDIQDAAGLVTCINDATYGVSGVTASSSTRDVHLQAVNPITFTLTSSNSTRLPVRVAPKNGLDIFGHERLMGAGTIDIGAIEHSLTTLDFTNLKTVPPSIKIERAGMQKFTFWAAGGEEFTKSVWVKWSNVAADKKPQIIVGGSNVTKATTTATGDGIDWEQISVLVTPTADDEVELFLYARDTDASAIVYFSDVE